MDFGKAFDEEQNKLMNDQSIGPGLYILDESLKTKLPVYPWAPGNNISVNKQGINTDYIDTHSELMNLTRPNTQNIFLQYSPFESKTFQDPIHGDDGFFNPVNSRQDDPAFDLKEFGINRWEALPLNPQATALEPFLRIGENTVLNVLDNHKTLCH
jgi:hypothetical protein